MNTTSEKLDNDSLDDHTITADADPINVSAASFDLEAYMAELAIPGLDDLRTGGNINQRKSSGAELGTPTAAFMQASSVTNVPAIETPNVAEVLEPRTGVRAHPHRNYVRVILCLVWCV